MENIPPISPLLQGPDNWRHLLRLHLSSQEARPLDPAGKPAQLELRISKHCFMPASEPVSAIQESRRLRTCGIFRLGHRQRVPPVACPLIARWLSVLRSSSCPHLLIECAV